MRTCCFFCSNLKFTITDFPFFQCLCRIDKLFINIPKRFSKRCRCNIKWFLL
nr:MAG TPA: hypothetical protein [Caudoviricetes sp.]